MVESAPQIYLAFAAGILSVLSPCVLPLMPAYLSLISGVSVEQMQDGRADGAVRRRVMLACLGFVVGFSSIFIVMGIGAVAAGHVLRSWRAEIFGIQFGVTQIAGILIILLGLHMTGIRPIRVLYRDTRFHFQISRRSFLSALVVGAGFALGWSPCIGPILATILTVAGQRETVFDGVVLLTVYSAGLAIPFLLAGWSIEVFFEAFDRIKRHFRKLEIGSGLVLVAVGVLLVTGQLSALNSQFTFMNDFINAAERALQ
ncbi:MAG: cytochrome c biogenesis protein CcdA [Myxococcales bacterium]|nr:cytochrome c biogenesis protein CcdA [Myxococcales bacterium]MDH5307837.1 cytochrome c biogenesis protein CcdA [Myxococcales bacterium]MDH5566863.1 cytochrome c biogenesis protein CcdA [Myxococcales bacterium]